MSASSWYRRYVWNYKGNREYTKTGYNYAKTRFIENDLDVDCGDRHYIVTGCNSGIGLEIGREIARRGGVLHMVCRNFESAKEARSEIITTTGNDKIHIHTVDMSRPREVLAWAKNFTATHDRLHVLVNNAGCMIHEHRIDDDGIEYNFAVNTLSVHILITMLLPLLQRSEDSRVVTVSSAGMLCVKLDPHDLMHENMEQFDGRLVYSQNKRQQVVMTLCYAQRYDKVHFSSMHPGWADTLAVRTSIPQFYEMMKDNLRTASEGADCAVWLAISKSALKHPSGLFYQDREPVSTHLPMAWTKSSIEDENLLMAKLDELLQKISAPPTKAEEPTEEKTTTPPQEVSTTPEPETQKPAGEQEKNGEIIEPKQANGPEVRPAVTTPPALVVCERPIIPPVDDTASALSEELASDLSEKCKLEEAPSPAKEERVEQEPTPAVETEETPKAETEAAETVPTDEENQSQSIVEAPKISE